MLSFPLQCPLQPSLVAPSSPVLRGQQRLSEGSVSRSPTPSVVSLSSPLWAMVVAAPLPRLSCSRRCWQKNRACAVLVQLDVGFCCCHHPKGPVRAGAWQQQQPLRPLQLLLQRLFSAALAVLEPQEQTCSELKAGPASTNPSV